MHYQYTAKSSLGENRTGQLVAASVEDVHRQLRERGLFVISAKPAARGSLARGPSCKRGRGRRVSKRDLVTLTSQLAIMARAGVDLASALKNLASQTAHPGLRAMLEGIHADVLAGQPVSQALSKYEGVFGTSYVAGIAAAEASGRLPEVLERLAALLRGELRMRSAIRGLLAYPIVLTSVSILVVVGLVLFVLPQFAGVFEQMSIPLPTITRTLISISLMIRGYWWLCGGGLVAVGAGIWALRVTNAGQRGLHNLLMNLVLVRDVTRALYLGRALRLLSTMLTSGVPLLEGLRLTRASIRNVILRDMFQRIEQEVINGRGLAATLMAATFVPPAAAQMLATAEQTGTLATVTGLVGEFYEEEGDTRLRELSTVLEPVIIILMGVVVAVIVMSVMLPIFDFATTTK
jgi:type II secretory pathway component PulF